MIIGGMFELETPSSCTIKEMPNTIYAMSGRCALYTCLIDLPKSVKRIAYVPAYTCETVLGSYIKAGFSLRFYDVDPNELKPLFKQEDLDGVGVMDLCGYYGFIRYDESFLKLCHDRNIYIVHDTTHSPTYPDPNADYAAGSLRKWMGIASGGVAIKKAGPFDVKMLETEEEHIRGRYKAMEERSVALSTGDASFDDKAHETFWNTELRLRKIFDAYSSDEKSIEIIRHFDFKSMIDKRRRNFKTIIDNLDASKGWRPVFTELHLHDVPSHFSLYADDRNNLQSFLKDKEIASTVYWPLPPMLDDIEKYQGAKYIYSHICSIQLDQRYTDDKMRYLASVLNEYSKLH